MDGEGEAVDGSEWATVVPLAREIVGEVFTFDLDLGSPCVIEKATAA